MAKALKTAALIVGAVALAATGVGALASAGLIGAGIGATATVFGVTAGTLATIGTLAGVASAVLTAASALSTKKPTAEATGSQTSFTANPDAGIPLVIGRTGVAGDIIYRKGFDTADKGDNDRQAFVSILSLGPVQEIEPFQVDRSVVNFDGEGRASGGFAGYMWRTVSKGALASAALAFGTGAGTPPGWTDQHKLSGLAAATWTLRFDTASKLYQNGVPAPMNVVKGQLCYDPRKDSTYPGGSGSHRMADPADRAAYDAAVATWEWTECPFLNGLKYVHGYWQRDMSNPSSDWQRVMGMGAPMNAVDVAAFVEGANISDANGWKVGGVIYSRDQKWDSLKKILQAGMGEPLALGARISCLVNAPKVSLATIGVGDVRGGVSVAATQPRRDRINTITPRYRLEANNWRLLPGPPIGVPEYVAADRGKRSKAQDYPFIQSASQVATAVRYDIENAREYGPITLPLALVWMGYKPGDCVTAVVPEAGLNGQTILLLNRELDPSTGVVTFTARSETAEKHPFALGQTTTPPPTPGVTGPALVPVPGEDAWAITGTSVESEGGTLPALIVSGAIDAGTPDAIMFEYRPFANGQAEDAGWIGGGIEPPSVVQKVITGVQGGTPYEVAVSYRARGTQGDRLILGPVDTSGSTTDWSSGVTGPNKPADNATNGADPASPFGPDETVGHALQRMAGFDQAVADIQAELGGTDGVVQAAQDARDAAVTAQHNAETAAGQANADLTQTQSARDQAGASAAAASESALTAGAHETAAGESAGASESARADAVTAAGQASTYRDQAATSASSAAGNASTASTQATLAAESAGHAHDDATAASTSASTASTKAGEAGDSASAASQSEQQALVHRDNAETAATAAQGSAASADEKAASAAQYAALSSTFASGGIGPNSHFTVWPDPNALPEYWSLWAYDAGCTIERVASGRTGGGWALRMTSPADTFHGIGQFGSETPLSIAPGWYHMVAEARLDSGTWRGAGLTIEGVVNPDLATEADVTGLISATQTGVRRWSKLVQVTEAVTNWYVGNNVFSPHEAKTVTWFEASLIPASQAEVAGATALEDVTTAAGSYGSIAQRMESVVATADDASASVSEQATAITDLQGRTEARFQITAVAGGRAQLTVYADGYGGLVDIVGDAHISGNLLVDGSVQTGSLADNAVTNIVSSASYNPSYYSLDADVLSGEMTLLSMTFVPTLGAVRIDHAFQIQANSFMILRVYINGTERWDHLVYAGNGTTYTAFDLEYPSPGATVQVDFVLSYQGSGTTSGVIESTRCVISEFKK